MMLASALLINQEGDMLKVFKFLSDGYPEYKMAQFRSDWQALSDESKAQLKQGIEDGTFDY
jgi:hypothetical protein